MARKPKAVRSSKSSHWGLAKKGPGALWYPGLEGNYAKRTPLAHLAKQQGNRSHKAENHENHASKEPVGQIRS